MHVHSSQVLAASIDLAPPQTILDATNLDALADLWFAAAIRDPRTAAGYRYKLRYWRNWWAIRGPRQSWQLRPQDLVDFVAHLKTIRSRWDKPLSYHTRNDILRRLRQLFRWAHRAGHTERDYSVWVPSLDDGPPPRRAASLEALHDLMNAADQLPHPARSRTILAVLIGTGVRRSECASIDVEDIQFYADHSGVMTVRGKRTRANRSGERAVAFDAETGVYLIAYLELRRYERGPLFRNANGVRLTTQTIYRTVKRCVELAGLEQQIRGCHDLRRAFATHVARRYRGEGYGDLLRRQLGHTSYRMTAYYTLVDADDIRDSLKSPLSFFDD